MRPHESDAVAAVVVTHDPDDRFERLIRALSPQVGAIWVVDNGSGAPTLERLREVEGHGAGKVKLIVNFENRGLAAAQNQGIAAALQAAYDWVLLMDHDSVPAADMVAELLSAARAYHAPEQIGFLVPRHDDDRGLPAASVFSYGPRGVLRWGAIMAGQVKDRAAFAMASGCLIPAERIGEVGPMAEDFFIDYIDYDFSFRIRRAGYRIIVVGAACLKHRLGERREGRFLGLEKSYREHSAKRRYTIYRNRIRVALRHGYRFPEFLQFEFLSVVKDFGQLLFWETDKTLKFRAIFTGIRDGLMGRGGLRED
jgi:GT2 family glycosyltransferase